MIMHLSARALAWMPGMPGIICQGLDTCLRNPSSGNTQAGWKLNGKYLLVLEGSLARLTEDADFYWHVYWQISPFTLPISPVMLGLEVRGAW